MNLERIKGLSMDRDKYVMLKAIVPQKETVSIGMIKNLLNVSTDEAEEMLNNLIQEGMVEAYSMDGTNFLVRK